MNEDLPESWLRKEELAEEYSTLHKGEYTPEQIELHEAFLLASRMYVSVIHVCTEREKELNELTARQSVMGDLQKLTNFMGRVLEFVRDGYIDPDRASWYITEMLAWALLKGYDLGRQPDSPFEDFFNEQE